jgi:signal transduction histidine kinase
VPVRKDTELRTQIALEQTLMESRTLQRRARPMAFPRLLSMPRAVIGVAFLAGYVLLDWASYIEPFGVFGITPWNPPPGLSFVLILIFGQRFLPLIFVAPLLADIVVRRFPLPLHIELLSCLIIGAGYGFAAISLLRPTLKFDVSLSSMRDMVLLMLGAVASAATVAALHVLLLCLVGLVPWGDYTAATLRYWIGDVIGIAVVTPFLLILLTRGRPLSPSWETAFQVAAIISALWIIFATRAGQQLQLFYILFLPIVWIAVRTGLEGVSAGLVFTQVGLIIVMELFAPPDANVTAFQALMLVLTITGLAAGVLVTERRRAEFQLRLQQDAQARLARLGSMGELAAALAHEINQPLTAAGTYARVAAQALAAGASPPQLAHEAVDKAVGQVERAAEVVRRLRGLIQLGRSEIAPVALGHIVQESLDLLRPEIQRYNITVREQLARDLPLVMADVLQVEQVLINLIRNSIEALSSAEMQRGDLAIEAAPGQSGFVEIAVHDNGPGFAKEQLDTPLQAFATTKADGLGIGLSLSRSIIEAHGGRLWVGKPSEGAAVHFTLPAAEAART